MFETFYDQQSRSQVFEESLPAQQRDEFNLHRSKTQNLIHFALTIRDFDEFLKNTPAENKYDYCLYKCYKSINDVEFDDIGKSTLNSCKNKCKKTLNSYKEKKLDIFYLLLMLSKRKTFLCVNNNKNDAYAYNNCNWQTLNKVRRRINDYWPDKLNKYLEAFD